MLPSSKRPPRNQDEVIRTGDFEVIHGAPGSKGSPRVSERPRPMQASVNDEDQTLLFSGSVRSMLPPRDPAAAAATPSMKAPRVPDMNLRGLVRETHEKPAVQERTNLRGSVRPRPDNDDRTILRPTSTLPPVSKMAAKPASPPSPRPASTRPRAPAMMPTPYQPMKPSAPPVSLSVNAPGGTDQRSVAPSNPHEDPPSAVITARTRIGGSTSRVSWAAGLVALGAVVGLVAAVVVRGDADSLIDATASFVDPSHGMPERANGAAAQAAVLPAFGEPSKTASAAAGTGSDKSVAPGACLDMGATTVSAPVVVNTPPVAPKTASIPGADPTTATRPTPPRPAPIAYAAPVRPARAAAAPAPAQPASTSSGWLANITPAGAGGPIARPSKAAAAKAGGGDFEGAAAADALAKAQLEASLR